MPDLKREGVGEKMKGFVYALQGIFDNEGAFKNIKTLKEFDDRNSMTNILWWICSRGWNVETVNDCIVYDSIMAFFLCIVSCNSNSYFGYEIATSYLWN